MKKVLFIAIMILSTLSIASCTEEQVQPTQNDGSGTGASSDPSRP